MFPQNFPQYVTTPDMRLKYACQYKEAYKELNADFRNSLMKGIMLSVMAAMTTLFSTIYIPSKMDRGALAVATVICLLGLGIGTTSALITFFCMKIDELYSEREGFSKFQEYRFQEQHLRS